jgi:prepilin-type N-terminal cleavage/methylation domain-containing protein
MKAHRFDLSGFTIVECLCALMILAVALIATLSMNNAYIRGEAFAEERRLALQGASVKMEELRALVAQGISLDTLNDSDYNPSSPLPEHYYYYGTWPAGTVTDPGDMPRAAFKVPGLVTSSPDVQRRDYVGTVSLIIEERPNEHNYGIDYSYSPVKSNLDNIGADINGNKFYSDTFPTNPPGPFPLDIDGDGRTNNLSPITAGYFLMPVVVTVHWNGACGEQRVDLFTILFKDEQH